MVFDAPFVQDAAPEFEAWNSFEASPEEPTYRGVSAVVAGEFVSSFGDIESDFDCCTRAEREPPDGLSFASLFEDKVVDTSRVDGCVEFEEASAAPLLPSDPLFKLERSCAVVSGVSASALGNSVLDFLEISCALVRKVNVAKFSIKADIFVESSMCTVKARVYHRGENGDYVVEFQRRCGCPFSFASMFQDAIAFLQRHFGVAVGLLEADMAAIGELASDQQSVGRRQIGTGSASNMVDVHKLLVPQENTRVDISPLLELARLEADPGLQAEAAAALSCVDEPVLASLCEDTGLVALESMPRTEHLAVAHPATLLLLRLAAKPDAFDRLKRRGMLKLQTCRLSASESTRFGDG